MELLTFKERWPLNRGEHLQRLYIYLSILSGYDPENPFAPPLLIGHSLSWKNEKAGTLGPNNTMCAKIWRPEIPKPSNEDKCCDIDSVNGVTDNTDINDCETDCLDVNDSKEKMTQKEKTPLR